MGTLKPFSNFLLYSGPTLLALASGTRLGPYEITAQIGVGGMGEVYRARDTKLDRDVASERFGGSRRGTYWLAGSACAAM